MFEVEKYADVSILVIISCYKAADLTIDCLRSLEGDIKYIPGAKVAVCENGTGRESEEKIVRAIESEGWSDWVDLKVVYPNRGFAGGNNVILQDAMEWVVPPKYFLLLNSDTIVRSGALVALLEAAEKHPDAGIIGSRLEWSNGLPQISCFRCNNPVSELLAAAATGPLTKLFQRFDVPLPVSKEPVEPEWTSFACAMIRREVVEQIGYLDEGFYIYYEDLDYCRRARQAGWCVFYWPEAHVVHLRGKSNPVKSLTAKRKRRPRYYYASRARYFAKYYGRTGLWFANIMWMLGRAISFTREWLGNKPPHVCEHQLVDNWINWRNPLA